MGDDEDMRPNDLNRSGDFSSSCLKLTESLIKDLYNGKEGNIKLLLLSDSDLLKFNERL